MGLFSRSRKSKKVLPEEIIHMIEIAPEEASRMRCSIIYSAEAGYKGFIFDNWKNRDNEFIYDMDEKPAFFTKVPVGFVEYYVYNDKGINYIDVNALRKELGMEVPEIAIPRDDVEVLDPEEEQENLDHAEKEIMEEESVTRRRNPKDKK